MKKNQGFTLIEIVLVIAIIGIISALVFSSMGGVKDSQDFVKDQQRLQDIKAALLSYVAKNGYLPCPDTNNDGSENLGFDGTAKRDSPPDDIYCTQTSGGLPFADLGTHSVNVYGKPYTYHVNRQSNSRANVIDSSLTASFFGSECNNERSCFNRTTPPNSSTADDFSLGNYQISNSTDPVAIQVPLVVVSHGKNGCFNVSGFEENNCNNPIEIDNQRLFYQAPQNDDFDDALIWLGALEIKRVASVLSFNITPQQQNPQQNNNENNDDTSEANDPNGDDSNGTPNSFGQSTIRAEGSFFLNPDVNHTTSSGDYNSDHNIATNNSNNSIRIGNDMNKSINLAEGDNTLDIRNDMNARIDAGDGHNLIRVDGNLNGTGIFLGNGNNRVDVYGNMNSTIEIGSGNNIIRKEGDINGSGVILGSGDNDVYIGGNLNSSPSINAGGNTVVYLKKQPHSGQIMHGNMIDSLAFLPFTAKLRRAVTAIVPAVKSHLLVAAKM
ncbi:type II secretion system protein [Thiomicrospira sp. R3]|uniref:type II secretion system protein n=1 Tax=Thiomicrospira sp. R3 TaxID=3035472 RepID=UPI00259BE5D1|nr:type II secretion system protein [Thiomicrospira sp. R3]WFE68956.1 type II secretion system protein [Thiomicrospira sp. R3]